MRHKAIWFNLPLLTLVLACEPSDKKSPTQSSTPQTGTSTTTPSTNSGTGSGSSKTEETPPPAHISKGWPPYTCPTYSAATATTEQEIDLKALKSIKIGDSLETMTADAKALLSDTSKVTTRSDVPVEGCGATVVYIYEADQYEDSGTSTAFSYRFWVCNGEVDKITFCPGIDGK